jgi:hypothetical protein
VLAGRLLAQQFKDLPEPLHVAFGLFKVLGEDLLQFLALRAFRGLWQRLHQLIFRAIKIPQLVYQNFS